MKTKLYWVVAGLVTIVAVVVLVFVLTEQKAATPGESTDASIEIAPPEVATDSGADSDSGRYVAYDAELVSDDYAETILFFYAPWCPECRAFDGEISGSDIPADTQVLRVDFDSSQDLRKKYDVTTQTTFVKVDSSGEKLSSWVGYGRTKTLDAVLENT